MLRTSLGLLAGALLAATSASAAEVWCPNPLTELHEGDAGKPAPKAGIHLVGARNGAFSGQVVLAKGGEAKMSDLKQKDGAGVIPASAVEVRYALPTGQKKAFDALAEAPRAEGETHPIWITVNVPANAAPGEYAGTLRVAGSEIPVSLTVHDWKLPDPKDWTIWADFVQSPESVALQYKVPLWSDEHIRLLGTVFEQLGKIGNKTIYLHLCGHSNFGNEETLVRWIKNLDADPAQGPGAAFTHDFSPVEKYLDVFIKHVGKPACIIMYDWEPYVGGSHKSRKQERMLGIMFSLYDPETKTTKTVEGPSHNNKMPGYEDYPRDYLAFLKPVYDGLYKRFQDRGIADTVICHGLFKDGAQPGELTVKNLKTITPWAVWADQNHGSPKKIHGEPVGYDTTVWNARLPGHKALKGKCGYGWKRDRIVAFFDRDMGMGSWQFQLVRSRLLGEMNIAGSQRGFGRMAADFWPVLGEGKRKRSIVARHPQSSWSQLNLRATPYVYPGPKGALSTVRLEMLREGMQECEARIFIEKALLEKKIDGDLAARCQALLDRRVQAIIDAHSGNLRKPRSVKLEGLREYVNSDWRGESDKLYAAAAEVAKTLGAE